MKEESEMKTIDRDVLVLKRCCKALEQSSSRRMLLANMVFLIDRYVYYHNSVVLKTKKPPVKEADP